MTTVKITTSCAGVKATFNAGETIKVDDAVARDLVQAGYAEKVAVTTSKAAAEEQPREKDAAPPKAAAKRKRRAPVKKTAAG